MATAALLVAATLVAITRFAGPEAPWSALAAAAGLGSGAAAGAMPMACRSIFGGRHMGAHYGLLFLGLALGEMTVPSMAATIDGAPVGTLLGAAGLAVAIALYSAVRLTTAAPAPTDG